MAGLAAGRGSVSWEAAGWLRDGEVNCSLNRGELFAFVGKKQKRGNGAGCEKKNKIMGNLRSFQGMRPLTMGF